MTPVSSPSRWKRSFRIATLVVPTALAWCDAFVDTRPSALTEAVKYALGPMWVLLFAGLVLRTASAVWNRKKHASVSSAAYGGAAGEPSVLAHVDVLTAAGSGLAWLSAFAIMGAVSLGWASLAVVGVLGTALFHIVVLRTFMAVRGPDPMYGVSITRRFTPAHVTEGDDVVEEVRFTGVRIPIGFRLFSEGRVGQRWPTSRHVVEASEAEGEVLFESDIGPALRGNHEAEPTSVWLQDTFGICRSIRVRVAPAKLTVLPRLREVEKTPASLDRGDGPRAPRSATVLPTEGAFRLREYEQGDDVRRIHWMRSLAARELIVRLPDEVPPDRPNVRLVLDTFFPEAALLTCESHVALLDSMVEVWLAVGRSLSESGSRVTLVTALPQGSQLVQSRHVLARRAIEPALRIGATVTWQNQVLVDDLLTDEATLVVSRASVARPQQGRIRWIAVVPSGDSREPKWPYGSDTRMPYPMGAPDNRWSHRRREAARLALARRDHGRALIMMYGAPRNLPGAFLARPGASGTISLEELRS